MLQWLDADEEKAGRVYETIRLRLMKIFYARGCQTADELADETIDRVVKNINNLVGSYEGNPNLYFYGVARRVFLEQTRKPQNRELPKNLIRIETDTEELEKRDSCLTECLQKLPTEDSDFILRYYKGEKSEKIGRRQRMMKELEISSETLRVRAFRIRRSGSLKASVSAESISAVGSPI